MKEVTLLAYHLSYYENRNKTFFVFGAHNRGDKQRCDNVYNDNNSVRLADIYLASFL